jgi:hypothetical protein
VANAKASLEAVKSGSGISTESNAQQLHHAGDDDPSSNRQSPPN